MGLWISGYIHKTEPVTEPDYVPDSGCSTIQSLARSESMPSL